MGVTVNNSAIIAGLARDPPAFASTHLNKGEVEASAALMTRLTADSATSTYRMFRVHSADRISYLAAAWTAFGAGGLLDVGFYDTLYHSNGGLIVGAGQQFVASLDVSALALTLQDITARGGAGDRVKRVWERLALTSDPNKEYDIVVKLVAAGATAADIPAVFELEIVR